MPRRNRAALAIGFVAASVVALPACELFMPMERVPEVVPSLIAPDADPSDPNESPIATMRPVPPDADPSEPLESPIATVRPVAPDADPSEPADEPLDLSTAD